MWRVFGPDIVRIAADVPSFSSVDVLLAYWEKRERGFVFSRPLRALRAACLSVYVALTNIPGGGLLTGSAMRSDPMGFSEVSAPLTAKRKRFLNPRVRAILPA